MNMHPYLFFDGNCREAFEFYARSLGVKVKAMLTTEDTRKMSTDDDQSGCGGMPENAGDKIMHACLDLGDGVLMGSDWMSPEPFSPPEGFSISINVTSVAEAERIFAALSDGGQIRMPLGKTFFAPAFGMLADRFGVPWMIHCEQAG